MMERMFVVFYLRALASDLVGVVASNAVDEMVGSFARNQKG